MNIFSFFRKKPSDRGTVSLPPAVSERIDNHLNFGENQDSFVDCAIADKLTRRWELTYVKASIERAHGKTFFMLSMIKGAEVIFTTSGFGDDEGSVIMDVLNYGLDFGVPAVVILNMTSNMDRHGRVYATLDKRFEPMVDFPLGANWIPHVMAAAAAASNN